MPRETDVIYGMTAGHGVTIEVDEAIFGLLTYEQRPGETYNDVVRRLLGMPPKDGAADEHGTGPPRATQTLLLVRWLLPERHRPACRMRGRLPARP